MITHFLFQFLSLIKKRTSLSSGDTSGRTLGYELKNFMPEILKENALKKLVREKKHERLMKMMRLL